MIRPLEGEGTLGTAGARRREWVAWFSTTGPNDRHSKAQVGTKPIGRDLWFSLAIESKAIIKSGFVRPSVDEHELSWRTRAQVPVSATGEFPLLLDDVHGGIPHPQVHLRAYRFRRRNEVEDHV